MLLMINRFFVIGGVCCSGFISSDALRLDEVYIYIVWGGAGRILELCPFAAPRLALADRRFGDLYARFRQTYLRDVDDFFVHKQMRRFVKLIYALRR